MTTRFSLTHKAFLAAFLILLPVLVIFMFTYDKARDYIREDIFEEMTSMADGYAHQVLQSLEMEKRRVIDFSSDGFIKDFLERAVRGEAGASQALHEHLVQNKISLDETLSEILVASADGLVVASTARERAGASLSGQDFFVRGLEGPVIVESGLFGEPALVASHPLLDRSSARTLGVVANIIPMTEIIGALDADSNRGSVFAGWVREQGGHIDAFLVNGDKKLIGGTAHDADGSVLGLVSTLPVRSCLENGRNTFGFYTNHSGVEVAGVSVCLPSLQWAILLEAEKKAAMAPMSVIFNGALAIGGVVMAGFGVLLFVFVKGVARTLGSMSEAARFIAGGNYSINLPVNSGDEIGVLSEALNTMSDEIRLRTQELWESEKRLKKAQNIARMGSWEWNIRTGELVCSDEACDILGLPSVECTEYNTLMRTVHPDDREEFEHALDKVATTGIPMTMDHRVIHPNGTELTVNTHCEVENGHNGMPAGLLATVQDITERKAAEDARVQLTTIIEAASDFIATADLNGRVLYFNNAARAMIGLDEGDGMAEVSIPDTHPEWANRLVLDEGLPHAARYGYWKGETALQGGDGREIPVSQVIVAHRDRGGRVQFYSTIARDVTDEKLAEERLRRKAEELDVLNAELHDLTMKVTMLEEKERKHFAEVLHESIGQNLVAAKLVTEMVAEGMDESDVAAKLGQVLELLDETIKASRAMTSDLYPAPLKDKGLIKSVEWYVDSILRTSGIDVSVEMDPAVETVSENGHQVLFSIARESFQNIVKYASAKKVEVTCVVLGGEAVLTVRDNGKGFSADEVKVRTERGFGLILMREWAKSVGGSFSLDSNPGEGTRIEVRLPCVR